ncbi:unnamed protein product [Brassica rapa]|uniref:tRNA pseudouridine(55) synthase n=1 Tax=Brassica campestris TaxID=3711 RepID=A0A8D9D7K9_BRACM|nr:unnamed protein product [Brassica rapa]
MKNTKIAAKCKIAYAFVIGLSLLIATAAEDPYIFYEWHVTYGTISPMGVQQQGILINKMFPGPEIRSVTNDNLIINVFNELDEPFLISWAGIQNRKNSFQDGVCGTTCPIPPGKNYTYALQVKDQIGSFYYFPSLGFHKAAGGFGGIRISSRPMIPVPFPPPADDYTVLIGDWYKTDHKALRAQLDNGGKLPPPDGILINGLSSGATLNIQPGNTYRLRISNVGLQNSLNFRIQNHEMTLVEVEGTHTLQNVYSSLDVHVGQSYSVLITANQPSKDYYIVVSSRLTPTVLTTTGVLHYSNSAEPVSGPIPAAPVPMSWSFNQARTIRLYLKGKYNSESWLQSEKISVKDALKVLVLDPLKVSLGAKSDSSSFQIRLTYSKASDEAQGASETTRERKKRKTDEENGSTSMSENSFEKVYEPCILSVHCNKMPIFFSGRYFKYSRNVSQTRWIIDDERMGEASVEELIGENILPACLGDSYKFHAAGREDIDVRMLGSGRPFLIEVQNSRKCPSQQSLTEIEEKINKSEKKLVGVKDLKFIGSQCWAMMREGEAEKQKQYAAIVWIARPVEEKDIDSISSLKELKILQKTPVRVLHRRSPLERERTIHWMKVEKIKGSSHYFLLHLCTQAGTYIKEFVHGDLGRTTPSMGSILGCRAEIIQLDVTDVKMGDS